MINIIRYEMRKAFNNKWLLISLVIGCALATTSAVFSIMAKQQAGDLGMRYLDTKWFDFSHISCFKLWLVVDFAQPTTSLFFQLLPILAILPFSWSYLEERKTGYVGSLVTRADRKHYFLSKYIVVFFSGALVITMPIILNFLICACFMPARMPDVFSVIYFGIYEYALWSEFFYTNPLLYVALFTSLNFIFSGLWAAFVFALSGLIKNRVALMIIPYLSLIYIDFVSKRVFMDYVKIELTPFGFLRGTGTGFPSNGYVVVAILVGLFLISAIGTFLISRKDVL